MRLLPLLTDRFVGALKEMLDAGPTVKVTIPKPVAPPDDLNATEKLAVPWVLPAVTVKEQPERAMALMLDAFVASEQVIVQEPAVTESCEARFIAMSWFAPIVRPVGALKLIECDGVAVSVIVPVSVSPPEEL